MSTIDASDVDRFGALVAQRFGLQFDAGRRDHLADVLRQRLDSYGSAGADAYLHRFETSWRAEEESLAERLTVGETFFFRYRDHFRAFTETVLRLLAQRGDRRLRVLSAGCASGEEPYSLAIAIREALPDIANWDVAVRAIDVNPVAIERALRARYSDWALRETNDAMKQRYFAREGQVYHLDDGVRSMVVFERHNLVEDEPLLWQRAAYDVVFCRNVLMYLTPEAIRSLVARIARCLVPGGFLFLGHAETLRGVSCDFDLCRSHEAFYYQRRESGGPAEGEAIVFPTRDRPPPAPLSTDTSWVDAIRQASERIAALAQASPLVSAAPAKDLPAANRRAAVELFERERFSDAIQLLEPTSGTGRFDQEALLLRAVLLTNNGRLVEAESVCRELLASDDLNAGAHYLMALCREHVGDRRGALDHDGVAAYLDADFAMPHLHRGLLARRAGQGAEARAFLERALTLLAGEDASRILLFGGGFSRDGLMQLCRAELHACGASR